MKKLIRFCFAIPFTFWLGVVSATPLTGQVRFLDPTGFDLFADSGVITGDLDTLNGAMSVDPFMELVILGVATDFSPAAENQT